MWDARDSGYQRLPDGVDLIDRLAAKLARPSAMLFRGWPPNDFSRVAG